MWRPQDDGTRSNPTIRRTRSMTEGARWSQEPSPVDPKAGVSTFHHGSSDQTRRLDQNWDSIWASNQGHFSRDEYSTQDSGHWFLRRKRNQSRPCCNSCCLGELGNADPVLSSHMKISGCQFWAFYQCSSTTAFVNWAIPFILYWSKRINQQKLYFLSANCKIWAHPSSNADVIIHLWFPNFKKIKLEVKNFLEDPRNT